jgi:hypothetical protein
MEFFRLLEIKPDYSLGNKFVADNNIVIYKDQPGAYDGMGVSYLNYCETKLRKK